MKLPIWPAIALALTASPVWAGKAHEHGVARLDIVVEARSITLSLESPLENIVGFERAPRGNAERQAVDAAMVALRSPNRQFQVDAAAGCTQAPVQVDAPVLTQGAAAAAGDHAELTATVRFDCTDALRAKSIDTQLFGTFARLKRIDVQLVLPKGQSKVTLQRPASRISLQR